MAGAEAEEAPLPAHLAVGAAVEVRLQRMSGEAVEVEADRWRTRAVMVVVEEHRWTMAAAAGAVARLKMEEAEGLER